MTIEQIEAGIPYSGPPGAPIGLMAPFAFSFQISCSLSLLFSHLHGDTTSFITYTNPNPRRAAPFLIHPPSKPPPCNTVPKPGGDAAPSRIMEKRTRRLGHKKSRNGCQRCKARRVKVRETRESSTAPPSPRTHVLGVVGSATRNARAGSASPTGPTAVSSINPRRLCQRRRRRLH